MTCLAEEFSILFRNVNEMFGRKRVIVQGLLHVSKTMLEERKTTIKTRSNCSQCKMSALEVYVYVYKRECVCLKQRNSVRVRLRLCVFERETERGRVCLCA